MLYLVPTPIGNLSDITFRAIETLKSCDLVLCEDTRVSLKLLRHFNIETQAQSFHQFNEAAKEDAIIEKIKNGSSIALISDAGTPGISDPGSRLVQRCRKENLPVSSIPGPCAAITALSASGLSTERFQFLGFIPRKIGPIKDSLIQAIIYTGTTIYYESPNRLAKTLKLLASFAPEQEVVVARELTKKFEEYQKGSAQKLFSHFQEKPPKGEIVLMIAGSSTKDAWLQLSAEELVEFFQETFQLPQKDAIKLAAEKQGVPKRTLYNKFIN